MADTTLKVGLAGAGMVSAHHLAGWARIESANVIAIADPDITRASQRAQVFHIPRVFEDTAQMIAEMPLDILDIAAPVTAHGALCRLAAERGLSILCQKPLAPTLAEARAIVDDVAHRVRLMVHENWRFRAHYRQVESWLEQSAVGNVRGVTMWARSSGLLADGDGRFPALVRQPFLADMPRFLVFEVLIHHLDVLTWLFGPLNIESAALARRCAAIRGEDHAVIRCTTETGVAVSLEGDFTDPGAPLHVADQLRIEGDDGVIVLDDTTLAIDAHLHANLKWRFDTLYDNAYHGAILAFVEAARTGSRFEVEAADHLEVMALVERVYQLAGWTGCSGSTG